MKNLLKNKKMIIILGIILIIILLFAFIKIVSGNKSVYGNRCNDSDNYKISSKRIKSAEKVINKLDKVENIDIYTKLCTVKIIITLKEDIDIEKVKGMSSELLKVFSEKELKYYDFVLYVDSKNEDSKTYPINVNKHNSQDSFAW